jgi:hypothetical protein
MLEQYANARMVDLQVHERQISQRMQWAQLARIEKLESALRTARVRLHLSPNFSLKAN